LIQIIDDEPILSSNRVILSTRRLAAGFESKKVEDALSIYQ
jgi:hypothetical protein